MDGDAIDRLLEAWREAARERDAELPGSAEWEEADQLVRRLREEYRRAEEAASERRREPAVARD